MATTRLPRVIGVIGAGQLGSGIAQLCAVKGLDVVLCDTNGAVLSKSIVGISKRLGSAVRKGELTPEAATLAKDRIKPTHRLEVGSAASGYVAST